MASSTHTLVWFRSDLRIADNPALAEARARAAGRLRAVFIMAAEQWRAHDWGESKVDFVLRSVDELAAQLAELDIPLLVRRVDRFEEAAGLIARLAEELDCDEVFANREYEVNERRRDRDVEATLIADGRRIRWFDDQVAVAPGELLTGAGRPYSVFTPFKRVWVRHVERHGIPAHRSLPGGPERRVDVASIPAARDLADRQGEPGSAISALWPAGEIEARRRLRAFVDERVGSYEIDRDIASLDATSRLSPYLAVGSISVRQCLSAALEANGGALQGGDPAIDAWINELIWREFYRHVLVGFPRVSKGRAFRQETEKLRWRQSESDLLAWCQGRTGVPFVDAGMRELASTGWMHNRLRMVTAMFLTKDLLIDWRHGERFFARHLIDIDLANNNGGWQWSASTGVDAAPYFRIFNPWTQSRRYDLEGRYIHRWVPELRDVPASDLHNPERLARHLERIDYPRPVVSHGAARIRALNAFERLRGEA